MPVNCKSACLADFPFPVRPPNATRNPTTLLPEPSLVGPACGRAADARRADDSITGNQLIAVRLPELIGEPEGNGVVGSIEAKNPVRHHWELHRRCGHCHKRDPTIRNPDKELVGFWCSIDRTFHLGIIPVRQIVVVNDARVSA